MPLGRDRRMQVSQGFLVVQPRALRHKTFDELEHAVGPIDEPAENLTRISVDGAVATFVKQPFGFRRALVRRQIEKRQEIARLVMGAGFFELCPPLGIDQGGRRVRKCVGWIAACGMARASTKIAQPDSRRRSALFRRPAIATSSAGTALSRSGPRNFAVRWNDPSLLRMTPSSTRAAQGRKSARRVLERRYSARFIIGELTC